MMKQIFTVLAIVMLMAGVCSADEMYCTELSDESGVPYGSTCSEWRGYEENAEDVPVCVATGGCGQPDCSVRTCNWTFGGDNLGCKIMPAQEVEEITEGNWVEGYSASAVYYSPFVWYHYLIYEDTLMATIIGILGRGALEVDGVYLCPTGEDCRFTEIFYVPYYSLPAFVRSRAWSTGDKFWN